MNKILGFQGEYRWGVCKGVGENNLGKIIMLRRQELIGIAESLKNRPATDTIDHGQKD